MKCTRLALAALICLALVSALRWPGRSQLVFNWDSVNHALAVDEYDLRKHQPHPPGYPVWIATLRGLRAVGIEPHTAQIVLAQVFTAIAAAVVFSLGAAARGAAAGRLALALLLFCPLVALYSSVAGTYAGELMTAALAGWFAARMWSGDRRVAPWAALVIGLCAGLRPSGAVFSAPLLAVSIVLACRTSWRLWSATAAAGAIAVAAWMLPMLASVGGLAHYRHITKNLFTRPFERSSWFYGAPLHDHLVMAMHVTLWLGAACAVALLVWFGAHLVGRRGGLEGAQPTEADADPAAAAWTRPAFLLLWGLPAPAFSYLVFGPYPGYLVAALPAITLGFGLAIDGVLRRRGRTNTRAHVTTLATIAALGTALSWAPFEPHPDLPASLGREILDTLHLTSLHQVGDSDELMRHIGRTIHEADVPPEASVVVALDVKFNSANYRKLSWVLTDVPVFWMSGDRTVLERCLNRTTGPVEALDLTGVQRIWWAVQGAELPGGVRAAFPDTRRVLFAHDLSLWATDPQRDTAATRIVYGHGEHALRRD